MMYWPFSVAGLALLVSGVLVRGLIALARRRKWYDARDERKVHTGEIPFLGGIGIATGFLLAAVIGYMLFLHQDAARAFPARYLASVLLAILTVHVTGVVDDFHNIPAREKLALQLLAAAIAVSGGVVVREITLLSPGSTISLGPMAIPFTVFWIVAITNAINLIDGMDGLAGSVSLVAVVTVGIWSVISGSILTVMLCAALAGALVGFLFYNLPPARVFMGDGGALFLGFALAVLPLVHSGGGPAPLPVLALGSLLFIPAIDTLTAIIRRTRQGRPIHSPDREHIHHKLQDLGLSVPQSLLVICGFGIANAVAATVYVLLPYSLWRLVVPAMWLLTVVAVRVLYRSAPVRRDEAPVRINGRDSMDTLDTVVPEPKNGKTVFFEHEHQYEHEYEHEHERKPDRVMP